MQTTLFELVKDLGPIFESEASDRAKFLEKSRKIIKEYLAEIRKRKGDTHEMNILELPRVYEENVYYTYCLCNEMFLISNQSLNAISPACIIGLSTENLPSQEEEIYLLAGVFGLDLN